MPLDIEGIRIKIAELEDAIEKQIPGYAALLNVIHKELGQQPELVYMLGDPAIAVLISGLERFHKVEVVEVREKKPISKKQGSLLSTDDV